MHLIPQPRRVTEQEGVCPTDRGFAPSGDTAGLDAHLGHCGPDHSHPDRLQQGGPGPIPLKLKITAADTPAAGTPADQGYRLTVRPATVEIESPGTAGLRHGLATLRQIIRQFPRRMPCVTIEDGPEIRFRGVMLDVSRGKVPRRETLLALIDRLSEWKYNVLQLYWEDTYRLPEHPLIGHLAGAYTREDTELLDQYCRDRGIELQPSIQTFSHMHGILRLPGYQHLAESGSLFTLAPGKEETYTFLAEILGEILPWFSSRTVNINMDEAYDLGTGFSATDVKTRGAEAVFLDHIRRVCAIARNAGATRILLWADCLNTYPGLRDALGDEVVWVDWNYNPMDYYPSLENVHGGDRPFWAAPGTSSWNALFPRTGNARTNIHRYTAQARKLGAEGILVTHWGDYGHHQPLSFSSHGFCFAAHQAWTGGRDEEPGPNDGEPGPNNAPGQRFPAFERASETHFFSSPRQAEAFRILEGTNTLPGLQVGFKTQTIYALFDDILKGLTLTGNDTYPAIPLETFHGLTDCGARAAAVLNPVDGTNPGNEHDATDAPDTFSRELLLAAHLIHLVGRRGILSREIIDAFATSHVTEDRILGWILTLKELYRDYSRYREEFVRLWDLEARPEGREGALYLFDKGSTRYGEAVAWLAAQRERLLSHGTLDTTMETYRAHESYSTLWTDSCLNLWDRAYPWR